MIKKPVLICYYWLKERGDIIIFPIKFVSERNCKSLDRNKIVKEDNGF